MMGERELCSIHRLGWKRARVETWENPHAAPAIFGLLEEDAAAAQREGVILGEQFRGGAGALARERSGVGGGAEGTYGTPVAFGLARNADERAEIHERGIETTGVFFWDEIAGEVPEGGAAGGGIDRELEIEETREETGDVGFDDGDGLVEGEGGHGVCGITTEPGEMLERAGKRPVADGLGGGVEIARASVVAETLPGVQDVGLLGAREAFNIREALEPRSIIREHGRDLGLLEHDLGDEDGVGVLRLAPGEVTAVFAIPGEEGAAEAGSVDGKTSNAERRTSNSEVRDYVFDVRRWAFDVSGFRFP